MYFSVDEPDCSMMYGKPPKRPWRHTWSDMWMDAVNKKLKW